jgi:hypothetical protein
LPSKIPQQEKKLLELSDEERKKYGDLAAEFFQSELGQYIMKKAQDDVYECLTTLKDLEPTDTKAIAEIQGKIKTIENFPKWLGEAIMGADETRLREESEDDLPLEE